MTQSLLLPRPPAPPRPPTFMGISKRAQIYVKAFLMLLIVAFVWGSFTALKKVAESQPDFLRHLLRFTPLSISDPRYRTAYHFQPPKNWINDPNGPMFYRGFYHLFYQYNPGAAVWGNIVWGHAVSRDLIHWTILEPALARSNPFDANGCWTGSATIRPNDGPVVLYTGADQDMRQVQNVALPANFSDALLREWTTPDRNPVIVPPAGVEPTNFRDPTTGWRGEDKVWRVAVGAAANGSGMALLYKSPDFFNWSKAESPLYSVKGDEMWECPDFYPVAASRTGELNVSKDGAAARHVLKMSTRRVDVYALGNYSSENDVFVPGDGFQEGRTLLRYDYGRFYASKTFLDDRKRRILWGWSDELDGKANSIAKGWAGIQTIPRVVSLDDDGQRLVQWPVEELKSLRKKEITVKDVELMYRDSPHEIEGLNSTQVDVEVEFHLPSLEKAESFNQSWVTDPQSLCTKRNTSTSMNIGPFGLYVLASKNLKEYTAIFFKIFKDEGNKSYVTLLCSDQARSSLRPQVSKVTYGSFVNTRIGETKRLFLRTLIDHSIVETFGEKGRTCITSRVYPMALLRGQTHLYLFNNGTQTIKVKSLKAWEMANANIDQG